MNKPKVTVYLSTYNQQEYVAQALDSILMQKTTFSFEILAADDCSTDDTQKIILDYQARYPQMICTYFTDPNVGGCKKLTNCIDMGLFRGEYLAFLEGDDYWLGEDRLQTLVDFLEEHREYSRVSHRRRVIDETGADKGYDISEEVVGKSFTIEDFLAGRQYSDFGSVFRNYFHEVGNKYHSLLLASRNVCDFQDMFITQDFGPVYVMDRCFSVYRSRCIPGASNYNSITSARNRSIDHIQICRAVEKFYQGKYDLSPMVERCQQRLLNDAVVQQSKLLFEESRKYISSKQIYKVASRELYLSLRGGRMPEASFLLSQLTFKEKYCALFSLAKYARLRIRNKIRGDIPSFSLRGHITGQV